MAAVGRNLSGAVTAYNRAVGSLEGRVLVTARRFVEMGVVGTGGREPTSPSPVDTATRLLQAPELVGTEEGVGDGAPADGVALPRT
jgi:DNA recombination protein RmuC